MDVCSVIGTENGAQVLSLAYALLRSSQKLCTYFSDPARIINRLNGEITDPKAFVQQRYTGVDLMRLVRRPILRYLKENECFESVFVAALLALTGSKDVSSFSPERPCCLVVFKDEAAYIEKLRDHAIHAHPIPITTKTVNNGVAYLTPVQMFTFLVLLVNTTAVRESFKVEEKRGIYEGDGSWMRNDDILTSTRVSLLPFMQWLQVRGDPKFFKESPAHPLTSELGYLPTMEDRCKLNRTPKLPDIGQIFGSLIPLELVNWIVHQKDGGQFAAHETYYGCRTKPKIAAAPVDLITVVLYCFYHMSVKDMAASSEVETMRLSSFPQFINLAAEVLAREDWIRTVKYPSAIKKRLEAMRGSFESGKIAGGDRALLSMLQIAVVFRERELATNPRMRYHRWEYAPIQTFSPDHFAILQIHCSPALPAGERFGAIMIRQLGSAYLRPILERFISGVAGNKTYGSGMRVVDFVHPEYTNSEVASLVVVPADRMDTGLQALQIYLHASATLANPETKIDTRHMAIGFLGALLSGGPLLFHWLTFLPRCIVPPAKAKPKSAPKLDLDLNSSDDDDDEEEEKAREQERKTAEAFIQNAEGLSEAESARFELLCTPGFAATLLKEAAKADEAATEARRIKLQAKMDDHTNFAGKQRVTVVEANRHEIFKDTLLRISMMCSKKVCMFFDGFKRMCKLDGKFYNDVLFNSATFQKWAPMRRNSVYEGIETADEKWFKEPPFQTDGAGLFEDDSKDGPPPFTCLDDDLVLSIVCDIASDLRSDDMTVVANGFRKFCQLVPVSRLQPREVSMYFPWLDFNSDSVSVIAAADVYMEHMNEATVGHLQPREIRAFDNQDERIVQLFGMVSKLQLQGIPARVFASHRLFLKGRCSSEVLLPANVQLNIFCTDLARIGSQLVGQLMFSQPGRVIDGVAVSRAMFDEAKMSASRGEKFTIDKTDRHKRSKYEHNAASGLMRVSTAAAAASSSTRAASCAASSVHASDAYSPTNPDYAAPRRAYSPPPSDEWKNDDEFTSRLPKSAAEMDPMSYMSPSSRGGKKRGAE